METCEQQKKQLEDLTLRHTATQVRRAAVNSYATQEGEPKLVAWASTCFTGLLRGSDTQL